MSIKDHFVNQFSSVQSLSHVWLFATPWIAARQPSLSLTNSRSSLRLTSIESVMPSSHLILRRPLLLLPPIPPSIRVFSSESALRMRWPKYWSFSFSIIPSKEIPGPRPIQVHSWVGLYMYINNYSGEYNFTFESKYSFPFLRQIPEFLNKRVIYAYLSEFPIIVI